MRACKNVPKLTVLIDSKVTMQGVTARFKGQFKPAHTANLDLYDACAALLHQRAAREGFTFNWMKVRSHQEDTPAEHGLADSMTQCVLMN